jgi:hypothetical protein
MILLITPSARASECAAALRQASGEPVELANDFPRASSVLRTREFSTVILDDSMLEVDPQAEELLLRQCGIATPIYLNLALCSKERLVRDVRLALQRRQRQELLARQAAQAKLRSELNDPLTALLFSCELVLGEPGLPERAAAKVKSISDVASRLCAQLAAEGEERTT